MPEVFENYKAWVCNQDALVVQAEIEYVGAQLRQLGEEINTYGVREEDTQRLSDLEAKERLLTGLQKDRAAVPRPTVPESQEAVRERQRAAFRGASARLPTALYELLRSATRICEMYGGDLGGPEWQDLRNAVSEYGIPVLPVEAKS